jgi:hypothetical protein
MTGPGYGPPPEYGQGGYQEQHPTQQFGQPPYGQQPQYGQAPPPEYGRPYGGGTPNPYGRSPVTYEFGVVGTVTAAIGAILIVIAFTAVDWTNQFSPSHSGDVSNALDAAGNNAGGLAKAYFGWLGWLLLVVTVVLCVAACSPSPAAQALRAVGAIAAAISIAVTFFAIRFGAFGPFADYLKHARLAYYLAMIGFLLAGIGALIGPRRREG